MMNDRGRRRVGNRKWSYTISQFHHFALFLRFPGSFSFSFIWIYMYVQVFYIPLVQWKLFTDSCIYKHFTRISISICVLRIWWGMHPCDASFRDRKSFKSLEERLMVQTSSLEPQRVREKVTTVRTNVTVGITLSKFYHFMHFLEPEGERREKTKWIGSGGSCEGICGVKQSSLPLYLLPGIQLNPFVSWYWSFDLLKFTSNSLG